MKHKKTKRFQWWVGLLLVLMMLVLPTLIQKGQLFEGADDQATREIESHHPDFVPWIKPLLTPASPEIESLLFSVQAAIGTGIISYIFGYWHGRKYEKN